jgi:C-terminal processing protease CtpA/Prc
MFSEKYGTIVGMLNYDMVGRYTNVLSVMGTDTSKKWLNILTPIKSDLNLELKKNAVGSSDHASFINKKIPSLFFTTGSHLDYHTSRDTADKINFNALTSISNYSEEILKAIDNETLGFNTEYDSGDSDSRPRGYGAHLGCVPEFGQSDSIKGVVCMKASPNSPAEKAGIVTGDILTKIGEIIIDSVYDLAFALKYYRAGDIVTLVFKRADQILTKEITLEKSKRE